MKLYKAAIPLAVMLLVGPAAAKTYKVTLHQNLNKHFESEGFILSHNSTRTDIDVEYNLSFVHEEFNKTNVQDFSILLEDEEETVFRKSIGSFGMDKNGTKYDIASITSSRPPDRIEEAVFVINHTGTFFDGRTASRRPTSRIDFNANQIDPKIEKIEAQDKAGRGENLSINISTSSIKMLHVNGINFTSKNGEFSGELEIDKNANMGENSKNLKMVTGRGSVFNKQITYNVTNGPPRIKIDATNTIKEGQNIIVEVQKSDDTGIKEAYLEINGERTKIDDEDIELETSDLSPGNYSLKATAVDKDDQETTVSKNLEVRDRKEKKKQQEPEEPETVEPEENKTENKTEKKDKGGRAKSFPEIFTDPIINFLTSLI